MRYNNKLQRDAYALQQELIRYCNLRLTAKKIIMRSKKIKEIALMKMGRNAIMNHYLLKKVFIPRFETFGLN